MRDQITTKYRQSPKAVSERSRNAKRYAAQPWRKWYNTAAWRARRSAQLAAHPLCELCLPKRIVAATVADHNPPHNGIWAAFIGGPLRSLCKLCHDGTVQREQKGNPLSGVDVDGRPTAPGHPWNAGVKEGPQ